MNSFLKTTAAASIILMSLACCTQPKFGGKLVTVELTSEKPADAYLIPGDKYQNEKNESPDHICNKVNTRYRGATPVAVQILPYMWVYIAKSKTGQYSTPITFSPDELPDGTIKAEYP